MWFHQILCGGIRLFFGLRDQGNGNRDDSVGSPKIHTGRYGGRVCVVWLGEGNKVSRRREGGNSWVVF